MGAVGARFELDTKANRYRITKILRGHNEEAKYRAPLTEVGVDAAWFAERAELYPRGFATEVRVPRVAEVPGARSAVAVRGPLGSKATRDHASRSTKTWRF